MFKMLNSKTKTTKRSRLKQQEPEANDLNTKAERGMGGKRDSEGVEEGGNIFDTY